MPTTPTAAPEKVETGAYMKIEQIEAAYPDHWIWIDRPTREPSGRVTGGRVIRASEDREELFRFVAEHRELFRDTAHRITRRPRGNGDIVISVWELPAGPRE